MNNSASRPGSIGLRGERGPILLAVMLSIGLAAIDSTILATALPSIVRDLGGFAESAWFFSGYLLAMSITTPIYGKLADMFGRKPVMLFGIAVFLVASLLCGLAWDPLSLILFRVLQGVGAGGIQPIGITIVGDIYTLPERAKVQSYIAAVWATSALVGPTLGGLFSDFLSWRWIFFVNLPIGIAAAAMLFLRYHERPEPRPGRRRIDYAGSVALAIGTGLLLLAVLEAGAGWGWTSPWTLGAFAGSFVALGAFVLLERRAADPVIPLWTLRHRVLLPSLLVVLFVGMTMMAIAIYLPIFVQNILGLSALMGGLPVAAMTIGWPLASVVVGPMYLRFGFRFTMTLGGVAATAGAATLLGAGPETALWALGLSCFVMGFGFGLTAPAAVVAAQTAVSWRYRGVATATNQFFRSTGQAVGTSVYAGVLGAVVAAHVGHQVADVGSLGVDVLMPALHAVFAAATATAALLLAASLAMPKRLEPVE